MDTAPQSSEIEVIENSDKLDTSSQSSEVEVIENSDNSDANQPLWQIDDNGDEEEREKMVQEERLALENEESSIVVGTPKYKSDFTGYLMEKEFSIETGKHVKNDSIPRRTCFNCLGDHNINECKERRNPAVIARNRMKIMGKKNSNVRYHEDGENRYGHFQPGKISKNLRQALKLKDFQAPEFIYRMRILGYPPGWLKEAEVKRSSVLLIDGSGKEVSHPDDEEGETDVCLVKYQPEKFISYPGFNVPFADHIEDEWRNLSYPPMQESHSRENFMKYMKMNKADLSLRKKHNNQKDCSILPDSTHLGDMDVDDREIMDSSIEIVEVVGEDLKKKEEGELSEDSEECKNKDELANNSSVSQSQLKQKDSSSEICLDSGECAIKDKSVNYQSNSKLVDLSLEGSLDSEECTIKDKSAKDTINNQSFSRQVDSSPERSLDSESTPKPQKLLLKRSLESENSDDSSSSSSITVKRHHRSSSKGFTLGVCIPESITPFKELPDSSKWSVDVSDHLLFDNLPDSTGTWQKMKNIVKSVQNEMQKFNKKKNT